MEIVILGSTGTIGRNTLDVLDNNPNKIRLFTLRSFGESFYHSITDASLEYGYAVD